MYGYGYFNSFKPVASGVVPFDPDAQAFITAASITDPTQQSAVNQLVLDLKAASIWTKMKAVYPMVGGSASSHKWNLKDPRDLDAAYRLAFNGGWTHGSTGATHNGTNAFAYTFWAMSGAGEVSNFHMSYYSRTQTPTGDGWVIGRGYMTDGNPLFALATRRNTSGLRIFDTGNLTSSGRISGAETDARGFYIGSAPSTSSRTMYKNGTSVLTSSSTTSYNSFVGYGVTLGACHGDIAPGTPGFLYQGSEVAFSSFGDSLNSTEAAALSTAVQTFNTTLSRNV